MQWNDWCFCGFETRRETYAKLGQKYGNSDSTVDQTWKACAPIKDVNCDKKLRNRTVQTVENEYTQAKLCPR